MLKKLEAWGYQAKYKVLNTKTQGLPQSRPRFYLVALLNTAKPFKFPGKIQTAPLKRILEPRDATPAGKVGDKALQLAGKARVKLAKKGALSNTEAIVDVRATAAWSAVMQGCSPCLTATRCKMGGHYLLHYKRMMTEKEICRLQGIPDKRVNYVVAKVPRLRFLEAVGNAMSSNVLTRVLACARLI